MYMYMYMYMSIKLTIVDSDFTVASLIARQALTVILQYSSVDTLSLVLAGRVDAVDRKITHTSCGCVHIRYMYMFIYTYSYVHVHVVCIEIHTCIQCIAH